MGLLSTYVSALPNIYQQRYGSSGHFERWANELLEELSERGFLPSVTRQIGVLAKDLVWIDKPAYFQTLLELRDPQNSDMRYRAEDVNGKFRLLDVYFSDPGDDLYTATVFSGYLATGITATMVQAGLTAIDLDQFKNYLLVVTAGTSAGQTIIISGNTASVTTAAPLTFLHTLTAALDAAKITGASFYSPTQYLLMKYKARFEPITSLSDTMPVDDGSQLRIIPAWLRWKCEQQTSSVSQETGYWQAEVERLLRSIEAGKNSRPIVPPKGRRLVGFEGRTRYH